MPRHALHRQWCFLRRPALTGVAGTFDGPVSFSGCYCGPEGVAPSLVGMLCILPSCCATPTCATPRGAAPRSSAPRRAVFRLGASPHGVPTHSFTPCSVSPLWRHSVPHGGASPLALSPALTGVSGDSDCPVSVSGLLPSFISSSGLCHAAPRCCAMQCFAMASCAMQCFATWCWAAHVFPRSATPRCAMPCCVGWRFTCLRIPALAGVSGAFDGPMSFADFSGT